MKIETITVGAFEVNCFILHGSGDQVLVVDPGGDAERIAETLVRQKVSVAAWLLTHGHADHLSALSALVRDFPAPVCMHPLDAGWAFSSRNQILPFYKATAAPDAPIREIRDGSAWNDAGLSYTVFGTPGHTPGGVCFYFPEARTLITGDTLFAGSAGRTDLPGGDAGLLTASMKRLGAFTDDVRVYPGHGPATTIGHEKRTNIFMKQAPFQENAV